jgi:hypothetical protein
MTQCIANHQSDQAKVLHAAILENESRHARLNIEIRAKRRALHIDVRKFLATTSKLYVIGDIPSIHGSKSVSARQKRLRGMVLHVY